MKELLKARNRALNEELPLNERHVYLEKLFEEYGKGSEEKKGFILKALSDAVKQKELGLSPHAAEKIIRLKRTNQGSYISGPPPEEEELMKLLDHSDEHVRYLTVKGALKALEKQPWVEDYLNSKAREEKGFIAKTARIGVQYARNEHDEDEFAEFKTEQRNYENALETGKGVEGHELQKEFRVIMP